MARAPEKAPSVLCRATDQRTGEPGLHRQAMDEVSRIGPFGATRVLAFLHGEQDSGAYDEAPLDNNPASPKSASPHSSYASQASPGSAAKRRSARSPHSAHGSMSE